MTNKIINVDDYPIYTPVLFMAFNRFEVAQEVFFAIRKVKPLKLYFAVDGARESHAGEEEKVDEIRSFVLNNIDWECEVKTLIRKENLGCKNAVSGAIDWVFENEDRAIILEDDCVPTFSFFVFCQELLERYKHDKRVMHINGTHYLEDFINMNSSYYLSKLNSVWGWATWKRAWHHYDSSMSGYIELKKNGVISDHYNNQDLSFWMTKYFDDVFFNQDGSNWDPVWSYAILKEGAFCLSPTVNLVKNIGFSGSDATHGASDSFARYGDFETRELNNITHSEVLLYEPSIDNMQLQTIIKSTDPVFLVKNFNYYLKKLAHPSQYLRYLRMTLSKLKYMFN
jgi:hypothetical protein